MNKKIIFIDMTTDRDHNSVKNRAIGASEYQFYNLIEKLSNNYEIICYNYKKNIVKIDNIIYKSWQNDLINDEIDKNTIIVIQRIFPNLYEGIYEKIKYNKIFLWIHDLINKGFILNRYSEEQRKLYDKNESYKNNILKVLYENKNINYIFVSNFIKEMFKNHFKDFYNIENDRLKVIYNILYENEYLNIKNQKIEVNKNYITYASAWQKGIEHVVKVFEYIKKEDNQLKLVLMSPGYDWGNFEKYAKELKQRHKDDVIIHGPLNKEQYSKIIKQSMVVLSTTFQETFGCVFAESYYLGTPVIADYRSGAVKEIIGNDNIVNFDNKKETIEKILYIKNNRDKINVKLNEKFMLNHNINLWFNLLK